MKTGRQETVIYNRSPCTRMCSQKPTHALLRYNRHLKSSQAREMWKCLMSLPDSDSVGDRAPHGSHHDHGRTAKNPGAAPQGAIPGISMELTRVSPHAERSCEGDGTRLNF